MSSSATFIFPHQLFKSHPAVNQNRIAYLVEEELFFNQYNFNKKKLVLHRASMKCYEHHLVKNNVVVHYIGAHAEGCAIRDLVRQISLKGITEVHYADLADDWLERRLRKSAREFEVALIKYPSPSFLNTIEETDDFFANKTSYFQTDFYKDQRKKRNLLLEAN